MRASLGLAPNFWFLADAPTLRLSPLCNASTLNLPGTFSEGHENKPHSHPLVRGPNPGLDLHTRAMEDGIVRPEEWLERHFPSHRLHAHQHARTHRRPAIWRPATRAGSLVLAAQSLHRPIHHHA